MVRRNEHGMVVEKVLHSCFSRWQQKKWMLAGEDVAESETAEYLGVIINNAGIIDEKTILRPSQGRA